MTQLGLSGDWCYTSVFSESVKKGGHLPKEGKRRGLQGSKCSPWRWEGFSWETGPGFPETFPGLVHSACTCAHTHTRTNMYTCVHTCTSTCMCTRHARTCAIHTCAHAYTYAHACTHARTHTHTHTHIHIPFSQLEPDKPQAAQVTDKTADMSSGETVPGVPPSDPQLSWF